MKRPVLCLLNCIIETTVVNESRMLANPHLH